MSDTPQAAVIDFLEAEEVPAERPPWAVATEGDAIWAVDRLLTARQRRDRIAEQCRAVLAAAERDVERAEAFFLPLLEDWARRNPPRTGRTIRLPTGSLSFRRVPGGPRVVDDAAALAWARAALPDAVRVVASVDRTAIKAYAAATGELPPGVELKPDDESFHVR